MSLPHAYHTAQEYFSDALQFLRSYAWIFQNANTCYLKEGVLDELPKDFVDYFLKIDNDTLNRFPLIHEHTVGDYTEGLQEFLAQLSKLIPREAFEAVTEQPKSPLHKQDSPTPNFRRVNQKKQHEIVRLAKVIEDTCSDCEVLIDFGSGLGYLSEHLFVQNNEKFLLLGLESDAYRVEAARRRLAENIPKAKARFRYEQAFVTEDSAEFIEVHVDSLSTDNGRSCTAKTAIIGLHACADLTVTSMRLFLRMPNIRRLVIMPCCYHKLQVDDHSNGTFRNFPLSDALRRSTKGFNGSTEFLNRPFLRLACQQTAQRWLANTAADHQAHGAAMFERAAAEAIASDDEIVVKLKGKVQTSFEDVSTFSGLCKKYTLKSAHAGVDVPWHEGHESKFNCLIERYPNGALLSEALTCLQTTIQKLCENIVLYDRICFMEEYGRSHGLHLNARFEKILNETLSPRCYALIAEKL